MHREESLWARSLKLLGAMGVFLLSAAPGPPVYNAEVPIANAPAEVFTACRGDTTFEGATVFAIRKQWSRGWVVFLVRFLRPDGSLWELGFQWKTSRNSDRLLGEAYLVGRGEILPPPTHLLARKDFDAAAFRALDLVVAAQGDEARLMQAYRAFFSAHRRAPKDARFRAGWYKHSLRYSALLCGKAVEADPTLRLLGDAFDKDLLIEGIGGEEAPDHRTLYVDAINGEKVSPPQAVWVMNLSTEIPKGAKCVLQGFETAHWIERVPRNPEELELFRVFVVRRVVEPSGLRLLDEGVRAPR